MRLKKFKVTNKFCNEMMLKAEDFLVKMKLIISNLSNEKVDSLRKSFNELLS